MNNSPKIAFIGAGSMARAIIAGLIQNNMPPKSIWACSRSQEKCDLIASQFAVHTTTDSLKATSEADTVVLCVKPFQMKDLCLKLQPTFQKKQPLIISVAAGLSLASLTKWCGDNLSIVRVMPNIAAAVNASATGMVCEATLSDTQKNNIESIFRSVGTTFWVKTEDALDALTVIAGSGPAYCFYLYEAMQQTAETLGLPADITKLLVAETAVGAAKLALETTDNFSELRQFVTSPNGATQAATDLLDDFDVQSIMSKAIKAAYARTKAMSE